MVQLGNHIFDEVPPGVSTRTEGEVTYGMWTSPDKIGRIFAAGGLYESPMLDWIHQQGFSGIALDVGANIGNHTLWMAAVCGLTVHAFEPVMPHVVNANIELNDLWDRVTVHAVGLGATVGKYHHVAKGVLKAGISGQSTDEITEVTTMDSFGFRNVSLIKIDVEGMELAVLKGGIRTIEREKPVILIEEWKQRNSAENGALLGPMGYRRVHQFGGKGKAPVGVWKA